MNFSTNNHCSGRTGKENIPPSIKPDALQVQRGKPRTVLGVLSENEQRGRSHSQGSQFSKHSSISDSSQLTFLSCPSSSSFDVYIEEACEVVLAASGQEVVSDSYYQDAETAAMKNEDARLLLELSSSSYQDDSMQYEYDRSLMSEEVLCLSQYAPDIHRHLRESEMRLRPRFGYLSKHPEITNGMRVILVDWLVEVVQEYELRSETLLLAVNYLDRFLSHTAYVKRGKLQLVGTAALMIAAKYEEISPPELSEFVYTTDSTYTKKQLVRTESIFLQMLAYRMAAPTVNQFLQLYMSIQPVCVTSVNLAKYVAELSLLEIDPFLKYSQSIVAAAAYCLAIYTINRSLWPDSLHSFTGYNIDEIAPCLNELHKLYMNAESRPQQAIRDKYKSSKYCHVSLITPPAVLRFI
ncbi:cyclin-A1 [Cheilinus undulatus]|uniref:cyclin-A1 n=1 Tax=Cheilinus undulatus TaxID=241271 RepID=UPI001BD2F653|nr:cyclin-A1 [Cheilinus undulatus]XP_041656609.1 cyclin-A1 [Cheilinus undulatus]XP_041656610.1 cyclin-A1 [Cheilinus undulatus]XP_041656611.1 cyclin-A1 [Cheilinus undulatus]